MRKGSAGVKRRRRGETLAEVLVALLIVSLSTLLLAAMVTASAGVNLTARQKDEKFYDALSKVEAMDETVGVKDPADLTGATLQKFDVVIDDGDPTSTDTTIQVNVYTSENLAIYKEASP